MSMDVRIRRIKANKWPGRLFNYKRTSAQKPNVILFIDDELTCHSLVNLIISNFTEYKLISAFSGKEALTLAKMHAANIALILSDILLPDISGYELYDKLSQDTRCANIPFVLQSGLIDQEKKLKKQTYKNLRVLYKPYKQQDLLKFIEDTILTDVNT